MTTGGRVVTVIFGIFGIVVSSFFIGVVTQAIDSWFNRLYEQWRTPLSLSLFKVILTMIALSAYSVIFALIVSADINLMTGYWEADEDSHISYHAEVGRTLYFFFVTFSSIGLGDVTMVHDSTLIVMLQYLLFSAIAGMK